MCIHHLDLLITEFAHEVVRRPDRTGRPLVADVFEDHGKVGRVVLIEEVAGTHTGNPFDLSAHRRLIAHQLAHAQNRFQLVESLHGPSPRRVRGVRLELGAPRGHLVAG